jgi:hypothetical protein
MSYNILLAVGFVVFVLIPQIWISRQPVELATRWRWRLNNLLLGVIVLMFVTDGIYSFYFPKKDLVNKHFITQLLLVLFAFWQRRMLSRRLVEKRVTSLK